MMNGYFGNSYSYGSFFGHSLLGLFVVPLVLWSLFWKGWALWKAARNGDKWWYVALLVLNTAGILEIIYIFLVSKKESPQRSSKKK